jgi:hypothetical protein
MIMKEDSKVELVRNQTQYPVGTVLWRMNGKPANGKIY